MNERNSPVVREKGLTLAFKPGEMIPWKGIWFQVESVMKDRLLLKPMTTTKNGSY